MPKPIRCILLVDDDPDDNFYHRLVIEESGLCSEVRIAESGSQALHYLTHPEEPGYERPDIIFLDINMPGMNGFEFLQRYHNLIPEQKSRLLLLMLTTSLNPVDKEKAVESGEVDRYYTKPLTNGMIRELVDQCFA